MVVIRVRDHLPVVRIPNHDVRRLPGFERAAVRDAEDLRRARAQQPHHFIQTDASRAHPVGVLVIFMQ